MKRRDFFGSIIGVTIAGQAWAAQPAPIAPRIPNSRTEKAKRYIRAIEAQKDTLDKFVMVCVSREPDDRQSVFLDDTQRIFRMPPVTYERMPDKLRFTSKLLPKSALTTCGFKLYDDEGYLLHGEVTQPIRLEAGDTINATIEISL